MPVIYPGDSKWRDPFPGSSHTRSRPRNRRGRGRGRRRGPTTKTLSKKVKMLEYSKPLNFIDTPISDNVDNSWTVLSLLPISHGDGTGQYEGDTIHVTSVQCDFRIDTASNSEGFNTCRIILFWDEDANQTVPTMSAASNAVLDVGGGISFLHAPYNHHTMSRFKILYDELIVLNPIVQAASVANTMVPMVVTRKFKIKTRRKVVYGTVGNNPNTNGLYFAYISNVASALPDIVGGIRVYYHP